MNESIIFNISQNGDILANATTLTAQIDLNPALTIELILFAIFAVEILWFFLWLAFKYTRRST